MTAPPMPLDGRDAAQLADTLPTVSRGVAIADCGLARTRLTCIGWHYKGHSGACLSLALSLIAGPGSASGRGGSTERAAPAERRRRRP
jgi:hypothetical protein